MHSFEPLDSLDFNDHGVFNNEIEPVTAAHPLVLIDNRKWFLAFDVQSAC